MSYAGNLQWPPRWTALSGQGGNPIGEVGVDRVTKNEPFDDKIFLRIRYYATSYVGTIQLDNPKFYHQVFTLLQSRIGYDIGEIGSLDLSDTL